MAEPSNRIRNLARGPQQMRLFDPLAAELMRELGIEAAEVEPWMQTGLLSYDPRSREKLNEAEEAELTFVVAVARSGLSYQALCRALSQLEKPYAYWPSEVLWDFSQGKWRHIPGEINSAVEAALADLSQEDVESCVERLAEDGDVAALETLMAVVRQAIEQAAGTGGGTDRGEAL